MKQPFEQWMQQVNAKLERLCGMGADDINDYCYVDCWNNGDTPAQAARAALRYARES